MNITCPECSYVHKGLGRDLIGKIVSCAECGAQFEIGPPIPQPPPVPRKKRLPLTQTHPGAVAFLAMTAVIFTLMLFGNSDKDRSPDRVAPPGPVVSNSSWDGSVSQVKSYVRKIVSDPDPEFVEWSPVVNRPDGGFMVRTRIRGRNAFGGYVLSDVWVWLDSSGKVERHVAK